MLSLQRRNFYSTITNPRAMAFPGDWPSAPAVAFVLTSLVSTWQVQRRKRKLPMATMRNKSIASGRSSVVETKIQVQEQRSKHFMKCVSISYANSGGLMILQGKGSRLIDETGRSFLDTRNNVCHVGHCHPRVVAAVSKQLATLNTNTRYLHPNVCKLAERLVAKCPDSLQVVAFVNSGSVSPIGLQLILEHRLLCDSL